VTALDAKTGKILWRFYTLPGPGDVGGNTWPANNDQYMHGGAAIWNTPALDPQLGRIYFSVGNCGPDYDGAARAGDNLFCASVVALNAKTGQYTWHFQEVHHDIWDYDAASPALRFDTVINGLDPKPGLELPQQLAGLGVAGLDVAAGVTVEHEPACRRRRSAAAAAANGLRS
jgi:quinohemoprotein ethanol dehydrogenase